MCNHHASILWAFPLLTGLRSPWEAPVSGTKAQRVDFSGLEHVITAIKSSVYSCNGDALPSYPHF